MEGKPTNSIISETSRTLLYDIVIFTTIIIILLLFVSIDLYDSYKNRNCSDSCLSTSLQRAGVSINFINNTAGLKGAAIYASDLRLCSWIGNDYPTDEYTIFELPREIQHQSPFLYL